MIYMRRMNVLPGNLVGKYVCEKASGAFGFYLRGRVVRHAGARIYYHVMVSPRLPEGDCKYMSMFSVDVACDTIEDLEALLVTASKFEDIEEQNREVLSKGFQRAIANMNRMSLDKKVS